MPPKTNIPDYFRTLSDEEFEKLPRFSQEEIDAMWRRVREAWRKACAAPHPRLRMRGRFYRRW